MFKNWQQEKATAALVDDAQAVADRLAGAKPHVIDGQAAYAQFWRVTHLAKGQDLATLSQWKPALVARFVASTQTQIAALRKSRAYESSDGLAVWLHTARAVAEPRIAPPVREIWHILAKAGPNGATMAEDLLNDAGLPPHDALAIPHSFTVAG